jgi:hypothetical protein
VLVAVVFTLGAAGLVSAQEKAKTTTKTAAGTVKAASGDAIVVAGKSKGKDAEWTFGVDGKTKITKGGKDVGLAVLKAGDPVNVRYLEHDGKSLAQAITITSKQAPP